MPQSLDYQIVSDRDELYKRIPPLIPGTQDIISYYKENDRLPSSVFKPHSKDDKPSVNIARLTTIEKTLAGHHNFGLASIITSTIRSLDLDVVHKPDGDNPAHAEIEGNLTGAKARKIAKSAEMLVIWPEQ